MKWISIKKETITDANYTRYSLQSYLLYPSVIIGPHAEVYCHFSTCLFDTDITLNVDVIEVINVSYPFTFLISSKT